MLEIGDKIKLQYVGGHILDGLYGKIKILASGEVKNHGVMVEGKMYVIPEINLRKAI